MESSGGKFADGTVQIGSVTRLHDATASGSMESERRVKKTGIGGAASS